MKAVILAAGEGIRLRPYTSNKPKGMIRVANNPILHYIIDALKGNGIREIIMVVGYAREKIMNYFGNGSAFGVSITYVEQKKQIGTAHALYHARSFLDSEFLVVAGDNIIDKAAVSELISNHGKVSVGLTVSETPSQYGVVSMDGPVIKNIKEKPEKAESNIISTGLYIFPPQIFDIIENMLEQSRFDITSTLIKIIENRVEDVVGVMLKGIWYDVVYPWDIIEMNARAMQMIPYFNYSNAEQCTVIKGPVSIGKGTVLRVGTYIEGPVVIGAGCDIGPYAVIRPATSIGDNCTIGAFAHIINSVVYPDCTIGSGASISSSVIGDGTSLNAGVMIVADTSYVFHNNTHHKVANIGALIGEDCDIGARVTIESGVVIGNNRIIPTCSIISKNYECNTKTLPTF